MTITEADVEQAAPSRLRGLGWLVAHGPGHGQKSLRETLLAERADIVYYRLVQRFSEGVRYSA